MEKSPGTAADIGCERQFSDPRAPQSCFVPSSPSSSDQHNTNHDRGLWIQPECGECRSERLPLPCTRLPNTLTNCNANSASQNGSHGLMTYLRDRLCTRKKSSEPHVYEDKALSADEENEDTLESWPEREAGVTVQDSQEKGANVEGASPPDTISPGVDLFDGVEERRERFETPVFVLRDSPSSEGDCPVRRTSFPAGDMCRCFSPPPVVLHGKHDCGVPSVSANLNQHIGSSGRSRLPPEPLTPPDHQIPGSVCHFTSAAEIGRLAHICCGGTEEARSHMELPPSHNNHRQQQPIWKSPQSCASSAPIHGNIPDDFWPFSSSSQPSSLGGCTGCHPRVSYGGPVRSEINSRIYGDPHADHLSIQSVAQTLPIVPSSSKTQTDTPASSFHSLPALEVYRSPPSQPSPVSSSWCVPSSSGTGEYGYRPLTGVQSEQGLPHGVRYDNQRRAYRAVVRNANGTTTNKSFSCMKYGPAQALSLAIEARCLSDSALRNAQGSCGRYNARGFGTRPCLSSRRSCHRSLHPPASLSPAFSISTSIGYGHPPDSPWSLQNRGVCCGCQAHVPHHRDVSRCGPAAFYFSSSSDCSMNQEAPPAIASPQSDRGFQHARRNDIRCRGGKAPRHDAPFSSSSSSHPFDRPETVYASQHDHALLPFRGNRSHVEVETSFTHAASALKRKLAERQMRAYSNRPTTHRPRDDIGTITCPTSCLPSSPTPYVSDSDTEALGLSSGVLHVREPNTQTVNRRSLWRRSVDTGWQQHPLSSDTLTCMQEGRFREEKRNAPSKEAVPEFLAEIADPRSHDISQSSASESVSCESPDWHSASSRGCHIAHRPFKTLHAGSSFFFASPTFDNRGSDQDMRARELIIHRGGRHRQLWQNSDGRDRAILPVEVGNEPRHSQTLDKCCLVESHRHEADADGYIFADTSGPDVRTGSLHAAGESDSCKKGLLRIRQQYAISTQASTERFTVLCRNQGHAGSEANVTQGAHQEGGGGDAKCVGMQSENVYLLGCQEHRGPVRGGDTCLLSYGHDSSSDISRRGSRELRSDSTDSQHRESVCNRGNEVNDDDPACQSHHIDCPTPCPEARSSSPRFSSPMLSASSLPDGSAYLSSHGFHTSFSSFLLSSPRTCSMPSKPPPHPVDSFTISSVPDTTPVLASTQKSCFRETDPCRSVKLTDVPTRWVANPPDDQLTSDAGLAFVRQAQPYTASSDTTSLSRGNMFCEEQQEGMSTSLLLGSVAPQHNDGRKTAFPPLFQGKGGCSVLATAVANAAISTAEEEPLSLSCERATGSVHGKPWRIQEDECGGILPAFTVIPVSSVSSSDRHDMPLFNFSGHSSSLGYNIPQRGGDLQGMKTAGEFWWVYRGAEKEDQYDSGNRQVRRNTGHAGQGTDREGGSCSLATLTETGHAGRQLGVLQTTAMTQRNVIERQGQEQNRHQQSLQGSTMQHDEVEEGQRVNGDNSRGSEASSFPPSPAGHLASGDGAKDSDQIAVSVLTTQDSHLENSCTFEESEETHGAFAASGGATHGSSTPTASASNEYFDFNLKGSETGEYAATCSECKNNVRDETLVKEEAVKEDVHNRNSSPLPMSTYHVRQTPWLSNGSAFSYTTPSHSETHFDDCTLIHRPPVDLSSTSGHLWVPHSFRATHQPLSAPCLCPEPPQVPDAFPENDTDGDARANAVAGDKKHKNTHGLRLASAQDESVSCRSTGGFSGCSLSGTDAGETPLGIGNEDGESLAVQPPDHLRATAFFSSLRTHPVLSEGANGNPRRSEQNHRAGYASQEESETEDTVKGWGLRAAHNCEDNREWFPFFSEFERTGYVHESGIAVSRGESHEKAAPLRAFSLSPNNQTGLRSTSGKTEPRMSASSSFCLDPDDGKGIPLEGQSPQIGSFSSSTCYHHGETADLLARGIHGAFVANSTVHEAEGGVGSLSVSRGTPSNSTSGRRRYSRESGNADSTIFLRWTMETTRQFASSSHVRLNITEKREDNDPVTEPVFTINGDSSWDTCCIYCDPLSEKRGDEELEARRTEGEVVSSRLTPCTGSASTSSYSVLERQTDVDCFRNNGFAPCRGAFVRDTFRSITSMDLCLSPRILSLPTSSQRFPSRSFFPIFFSLLTASLRLPSVAGWSSPTSQFNSCFVFAPHFVIKRRFRLPATRLRMGVCPALISVRELLSGERDGLLFRSFSAGITTKEGICVPACSASVSPRPISSMFCDSLLLRKGRRFAPSLYEGESPRAGDSTREEECDLSPEGSKELNEEDSASSAFPTLPPDECHRDVDAPCLRQSGNAYESDETTACLSQGVEKQVCALKEIRKSFADQIRRGEKCGGVEESGAREELSQRVTHRRNHSRQGQILVLPTQGGHEQAWLSWLASRHALTGVEPLVDSMHGGLSEEAHTRETKESGMCLFQQVDSGSGDGHESATESIIESCEGTRRTVVARGSIHRRPVLMSSFDTPPVGVSPSIEASASIVASRSTSASSLSTPYLPDPTLDSGGYQLANALFDLSLIGSHSRRPFAGIHRSHPLAKRRNGEEFFSVSCVAAEVTANAPHRNSCRDSADSRDVRRCSPSLKPSGPTDSKAVTVIDNHHCCGQECLASLLTKHEYSPVDQQLRRTYKDTLNMWTVNRTGRSTLLSYHRHSVFMTSAFRSPLVPPRHQTIALFAAAVCVDNEGEQDTILTTDADRAGAGEAAEAGNEEESAGGNCQNASEHTVPDRESQVPAALPRNARRRSELPGLRRQGSSENEGANAHKHGRPLAREEQRPRKLEGESKEAEKTDSSPSKMKQHATAKPLKDVDDNRRQGKTRRKRPLCETSNESEKADGENRPMRKSPRAGQAANSAPKPRAKKPLSRETHGARPKGRENKQSDATRTAGESEDQRKEIAHNEAGGSPGTSTAEAGHRPQTRNARRRARERAVMNTQDNGSPDRSDRASQPLAKVGSQAAKRERERGELKEQESASPDRTDGAAEHPSKQVGDKPKSEQQSWNEHERGEEGAKTGFADLPSPGQTGNTLSPKTPQKARGRREHRKPKSPQDSADTLEKPVVISGKTTGAHLPARGRRRRLTSPGRSTPDRRTRRRMQMDQAVSLSLCASVASATLFASPSATSSAGALATTAQIGTVQERTEQETHLRANMQVSLLSNQRATAERGVSPHLLVPSGDAGPAPINAEDKEKPEEAEDRTEELRSGTQQSRNKNTAKGPTADRYGEDIVADTGTKDDFPVEQGQRVEAGAFVDEEALRSRPALRALLRARREEEEREALEGGRGKEPGSRRSLRPRRPSWRLCQAFEDLVSPGDVLNRGMFLTPSEAEPNEVDSEMESRGVGEQVNSGFLERDATEQKKRATPQKRCRRRTTGRRRSGARRKVGNQIRVASPVSAPLQRWEGPRPRPTVPTIRTRKASPSFSPERASKASTFGSLSAYSSSTGGVETIVAEPPKREGERRKAGCQYRNVEEKRVTRQRADGSMPGPSLEANRGSNGKFRTEDGNVLKHELAPGDLPIVQAQPPTLLFRPAGEQRRSDAPRPSSGSSVERGRTLLLPSPFDVFRPNAESDINFSGDVRSLDSTLPPDRRATVPQLPPISPVFASRSASPAATSRFPRLSGQVQSTQVFDHRPQARQASTWAPHFPTESPLPADDVENFHMAAIGLTTPSTPMPEYFLRTRRGRSPQQGSRPSLRSSSVASLTAPPSSVPSRSPSESLPFLPMRQMSGRRTEWTRQVAQERFREEVEGRLFAASVSGTEARGNYPPAKTTEGIPESAPQSEPAVESLPPLPSAGPTFLTSSSPRLSTFSSRSSPEARSSLRAAFASLERGGDIHPSVFRVPAGQRSWQSVSPSPYFRRVRPVRLLRERTSSRNLRFESPPRGDSSWAPSVVSSKSPGVGDQSPTVVSARFWRGFSPAFSPRTHDGQPRESLERAQLSTCPTPQPYLPSPPGVTSHSWDPLEAG